MSRGIYITANDRALDQSIALLNSIRLYDAETPIVLIPYDDDYQIVAERLGRLHGVQLYPNLALLDRLSKQLQQIFGDRFFARPHQFRKQACWFGEFDRFLYVDTDIVVFEKIIDNLDYLENYNFICSDYQHKGGITNVFTDKVIDRVFDIHTLQDVFNGGFWGAKRHLISETILYDTFAECAAHLEYFDFSQKTSDQPILNYMILKQVERRFNIVRRPGKAPGNWAGSRHFVRQGHILIDPNLNQPLQYLHWAGIRIQPGCPYWEVWRHYRYLHEPEPPESEPAFVDRNQHNQNNQHNRMRQLWQMIRRVKPRE